MKKHNQKLQAHKRSYEQTGMPDYQLMKRRLPAGLEALGPQQRLLALPSQALQCIPAGSTLYPGATIAQQQIRLLPPQMTPQPPPPPPQQLLLTSHPNALAPVTSTSLGTIGGTSEEITVLPPGQQQTPFIPQNTFLMPPNNFTNSYFEENIPQQSDPFTPPSYAPEMKNAVVLQPL